MLTGGSPIGAPRAKDGSKGAAGRFGFVTEVARGYLGALWVARDPADASPEGTVYTRHVTPLVAASARAAILEGARWALAGADSTTYQVLESRTAVDLITPFIDGEPLRSLLRTAAVKHATPEPSLVLALFRELVEQIEPMHERSASTKSPYGFGSINPDSILVDLAGAVHLLDIGAGAAASSREPWRSDPQRVGYFAPEQTEARGVVDARTDVFAVGVLLWEALANRRLFPGNDGKTCRERVQRAPITRLDTTRSSASPGIATNIADVVAKCLERDPAARFQSMSELASALEPLAKVEAARVGAWVSSLSDVVIAKRRQALSRAASGQPVTDSLPPPPSVGERRAPTTSSLPARPATPRPSNGGERTSVLPPSARATLPNPTHAQGVSSGSTLPGGISRAAPPPPSARAAASMTPVPPSARAAASMTPVPSSARAAASTTPVPPTAHVSSAAPPPPPSTRSDATSTPLGGIAIDAADIAAAARPSVPPRPERAPEPALAAESEETPASPATEATTANAVRSLADSAENIDPEEEDAEEDVADDVEDDDGAASAPEDASGLSHRPPPLPHDDHTAPLAAFGPAAGHGEPLASPIHTTQLASLTAPPPGNPLPRRAAIAALVTAVGLGMWFLGRSQRAHTVEIRTVQPQTGHTVETPPVQIDEHLSAVSATPPAERPPASAAPVPEPPPKAAPVAPPPETPAPAPHAAPTPAVNTEKSSTPKTTHAASTPGETAHRPAASTQGNATGYKPGGI